MEPTDGALEVDPPAHQADQLPGQRCGALVSEPPWRGRWRNRLRAVVAAEDLGAEFRRDARRGRDGDADVSVDDRHHHVHDRVAGENFAAGEEVADHLNEAASPTRIAAYRRLRLVELHCMP